jgi:Family of unknown function (DUF6011)
MTVTLIPSYRKPSYRRVEAKQSMPVGMLDRLINALIAENHDKRTLLRLSTSTHDEIVIARDRRGRERIEIRSFADGAYQLTAAPHVFILVRSGDEWTLASKYGFRDGCEGLSALHQAAERLVSSLADLDIDPLAHPPRGPHCMICGRHLTDSISVGVGIGPECGVRYPWLFERRGRP